MNQLIIKKVSAYSYYFLMLFLPTSMLFANISLVILFLSILLKKEKKTSYNLVVLSLLIFFIYLVANSVFNASFYVEKPHFIKVIPLIIIPYSIINIDNRTKKIGLMFLLAGILIIQLKAMYGIIDYYYFSDAKKYSLKNYANVNAILRYERPYLGYFSAISIAIDYYFFKQKKAKFVFIFLSIFSFIVTVIIGARLAIIIILLVILIFELKYFRKKTLILLLSIMGLIFFFSAPNLKDRFFEIKNDARLIIWKGAYNIFGKEKNYWFGSGSLTKTREKLYIYYKEYNKYQSIDEKNRFVSKNYNTHNQYINELLRGGFFGLLLFIVPQFILLFFSIKQQNTLYFIFLISIFCFCFVENILERQIGVYLYAILLSFAGLQENQYLKNSYD
ncbi:O-antigen ligase family protein [Tenacibaculum sp. UWU-22]|uniref:O-antigen ligase family protein n=1 Tax=Tenacibaculum sp. UWU-22 TaxID=3234187 RepID=UPI0034DB11E6